MKGKQTKHDQRDTIKCIKNKESVVSQTSPKKQRRKNFLFHQKTLKRFRFANMGGRLSHPEQKEEKESLIEGYKTLALVGQGSFGKVRKVCSG